MRRTIALAIALCAPLLARAERNEDDGRSPEQRAKSEKTEQNAKKGALRRRADPKQDLEHQRKQAVKLRKNVEGNRQAGNHVGAWAAERDLKKVEKAIRADEARIGKSKSEDAPTAEPAREQGK